jgi:aspartate aminotransferase
MDQQPSPPLPSLSRRATTLAPSPTMAIDSRAKQIAAEGIDVVNLSIGEPDFPTPEVACAGGIDAIRRGLHKYTPAPGTVELRKAIAAKLLADNGLEYAPDEIVVSNGAKHSIYNALMVLVDPGDEVIVPAPYWVSYPDMAKLCGGVPVLVYTDPATGFRLTPEQLRARLTPKTKVLILNSPSNPTGSVYTPDELRAIAEVAVEHGVTIISDEIYEKLVYDDARFASVASFGDHIRAMTVTVNGMSKAYAMTGWRMGYAATPKPIAKAMADLQSQTTSGPSSITQEASRAALLGDQAPVETMRQEFDRRRRYVVDRVRDIPGFTMEMVPTGAFYVFPNITGTLGLIIDQKTIGDADDLALRLLDDAHVAVVPGKGFGTSIHVRISYAASMERLEEGFDRIAAFLARA